MAYDVAVVMGTWNRLAKLQACVASLRAAMGELAYVILVADGSSTDGSREWLANQADCELLEGGQYGAVHAFNASFARAVDLGAPWVLQFNDDLVLHGDLRRPVEIMQASVAVGAVAFPSTRYTSGTPTFENMRYHGRNYCNQGLFRREAGMAAARFLGDPTGKAWWTTIHRTYASDTELGLALWRLGWVVSEVTECWVEDGYTSESGHLDLLRQKNLEEYTTGELFIRRWGNPLSVEYNANDARQFGGMIR